MSPLDGSTGPLDGEAERAFRGKLRGWLATALATPHDAWNEATSRAWAAQLYDAGYAGVTWPLEYGGGGLPLRFQAIYLEETARAGAAEHVGVIGLGMVGPAILAHGTPEQKAHFLPRILSGEYLFCQGFSEPEAGSDLAAVSTRAEFDGDVVTVTGHKLWSSYAPIADHCLLLARMAGAAAGRDGLTCLLVDLRTPGIVVRPIRQLTGDEGFGEITLTGARIPRSAVLGEPGDGWRVATTTLSHERGTFGVTLAARLRTRFDELVTTVKALGHDRDPLVRDRVAALAVGVEGLWWTAVRAFARLEATGVPGPESAIVKLCWSRLNQRLTSLAVELQCDDALLDGPWQREQLRSRANSIEGGTSEILRSVIAERVLALPRSR
jgi:alkylation response protein AidB-like acyl-CoA dehydrogenase